MSRCSPPSLSVRLRAERALALQAEHTAARQSLQQEISQLNDELVQLREAHKRDLAGRDRDAASALSVLQAEVADVHRQLTQAAAAAAAERDSAAARLTSEQAQAASDVAQWKAKLNDAQQRLLSSEAQWGETRRALLNEADAKLAQVSVGVLCPVLASRL